MSENNGILIYAQLTRDGSLVNVVLELANAAMELSQKLNGESVQAVLISGERNLDDVKSSLKNAGFDKVYIAQDKRLDHYSTELYSKIVIDLVKEIKPSIMLIGATTQGRDLAPVVSSTLNTGLTADCTKLDINEKGQLAATRPTFGGNLMATILCKNYPQMASVRPKVLKKSEIDNYKETEFVYITPQIQDVEQKVELIEFIKNIQDTDIRIDEAEIIVAGGKGVKTEAGFNYLKELAKLLGGAVGASRGAVDAGLANSSIQVGQTGKTVMPKIYIAAGISGAIQHTVGMSGAQKIIAINNDANAPIFNIADVGIVGDLNQILPELIEQIKNRG